MDIILRVREIRPKLWEQVLDQLKKLPVAENSELGLSKTLAEIQSSLRGYLPLDWASDPQLRVSDMTREHLRKVLTVFMATGATTSGAAHFALFQHHLSEVASALSVRVSAEGHAWMNWAKGGSTTQKAESCLGW